MSLLTTSTGGTDIIFPRHGVGITWDPPVSTHDLLLETVPVKQTEYYVHNRRILTIFETRGYNPINKLPASFTILIDAAATLTSRDGRQGRRRSSIERRFFKV